MGMESYQVVLTGGDATADRVRAALLALPGVRGDEGFLPNSEYFTLRDGGHVFEFELTPNPLRLSLRFALTHPPSVDAAFLSVVRKLVTDTGLRVRLLEDDVPPEFTGGYDVVHFAQFAKAVSPHIAEGRRIWIATFGPTTRAVSTGEAWESLLPPRHSPVTARSKEHG